MRLYLLIKRLLDLCFTLLSFLILWPVLLLVALWIRIDSPGPVLFRQTRIGKDEKPFSILKFRTMYVQAPPSVATAELSDAFRYITRAGRILRKASLDELPQLINILRGEMSLIGPRPLVPEEKEIHTLRAALGVYRVLPGITGWAQVNGRDCLDPPTKAALDAYYADHVSFVLDAKVMFFSLLCVITARGIQEGNGTYEDDVVEKRSNGKKSSKVG
ncbi:MAG: sugar transferase [Clostridia bacterium]